MANGGFVGRFRMEDDRNHRGCLLSKSCGRQTDIRSISVRVREVMLSGRRKGLPCGGIFSEGRTARPLSGKFGFYQLCERPHKLSKPQNGYISSEKSGKKPTGLYRIGQDEDGNRKIFYEDMKAVHADGKEPKAEENRQGKPAEKCVTNTDKVDQEIKKLKEKKQKLEQQIQSASGDEKKIRELEKKLAQIEHVLSQKDNDTYRRQNASVSE